jgi:hypothetical protein
LKFATIRNFTDQDRIYLRSFGVSDDGVLGPLDEFYSLGVVARLSGDLFPAPLTIIAAGDNPTSTAVLMKAIMNNKAREDTFMKLGWREKKALPRSFEMLFLIQDQIRWQDFGPHVRLLAWREINNYKNTR